MFEKTRGWKTVTGTLLLSLSSFSDSLVPGSGMVLQAIGTFLAGTGIAHKIRKLENPR